MVQQAAERQERGMGKDVSSPDVRRWGIPEEWDYR